MFSRTRITTSTGTYSDNIGRLKKALAEVDTVVIGAGAGLSTSAGFVYKGERFEQYFFDFAKKYHFSDMYSGGFYQSYFYFDETEALDSVQEQDGELLVTTEKEDADDIRAYLEVMKVAYGDEFETEYGEGAKLISVYHVDAESLEIKECTETMRLADGSEVPLTKITVSFDVEIPDPAAPGNSLAPAFDEAAERRTITVVFASGTPEEQTCVFTIPEGIDGYVQYHGEYMDLYEDPECTQPFTGRNGRMEFTVYTKGSGR